MFGVLKRICSCDKLPTITTILRCLPLWIGSALCICSCTANWFDIPASDHLAHSVDAVFPRTPDCQSKFQLSMALGWACFLFAHFVWRRTLAASFVACSTLYIALIFPYFTTMRAPELAADATWLQMQHDNLTWLGGDIYSEAEAGMDAWKSKVYWVDPPRQVVVVPIPSWSVFDAGLDKIEDVLIWTGYSNVFCQFARRGWYCAVLGSMLLLLSSLLRTDDLDLSKTGYAILFLAVLTVLSVAFALWRPFLAKSHLQNAFVAMSRGNYEASLNELNRCSELIPVLAQDSNYVSQRGIIETQLGIESDYSQLNQAKELEGSGRYDQAYDQWHRLCESESAAIRREALRAVLRFAIQDYNCNRIALSRQRLRYVLSRQPGNLKVVYYLQVIGVREQDSAEVYRMCEWMQNMTGYLNFGTTKILTAASQQNAKLAAALDRDPMESWIRSIEAK